MTLFLSTYVNRIDKKGRVSVPSNFRSVLTGQGFYGVVLFRSTQHDCLEGVSWDTMADLGQRLDDYDFLSSDQDNLATILFGEAVQLPLDGDGRIVLPSELVEFAKIEDQSAFVGMGRKFQIWNPELFEARKAAARKDVKEGGLTLSKGGGS